MCFFRRKFGSWPEERLLRRNSTVARVGIQLMLPRDKNTRCSSIKSNTLLPSVGYFFFILLGFSVLLYCPCHQSYSINDINYKQQIDSCSSSNQKHLNLLQLLGLGQHLSDWKQAWIKSQTSQLQVKVKVTWESFPRASRLSPSQYSKIRVWIQFPRF